MAESLIEFPARIAVKAMGLRDENFAAMVSKLVCAHLDEPEKAVITEAASSKGKYLSVSVTFTAKDQQQLEAIYTDLHACEDIVYTL